MKTYFDNNKPPSPQPYYVRAHQMRSGYGLKKKTKFQS